METNLVLSRKYQLLFHDFYFFSITRPVAAIPVFPFAERPGICFSRMVQQALCASVLVYHASSALRTSKNAMLSGLPIRPKALLAAARAATRPLWPERSFTATMDRNTNNYNLSRLATKNRSRKIISASIGVLGG